MKCLRTETWIQILQGIIFTVLLVIACVFAKHMIDEYLERKTRFSSSKKPLTHEDIPTLTICFRGTKTIKYGVNIWFETFTDYTESTLRLGLGINAVHGHFIKVKKLIMKERRRGKIEEESTKVGSFHKC